MSRKIQTKTVRARGGDQLAALGAVHDALGLRVDHFNQYLNSGLEATRHAGRGLAGGQPQEPAAEDPEGDGPENGVVVEDCEVDHRLGLVVLKVGQVVNDVFTSGGSVFSSHLLLLDSLWAGSAEPVF